MPAIEKGHSRGFMVESLQFFLKALSMVQRPLESIEAGSNGAKRKISKRKLEADDYLKDLMP